MRGGDLHKDLINYIGRRVLVAYRDIKPKLLDDVCSRAEESCAEQEAVYLIGLADGLVLADLFSAGKLGDADV